MKKAVTYRIDEEAINIVDVLSNKSGASKTEVVERAIYAYALVDKKDKNDLLMHAGKWSEDQADKILKTVQSSRSNRS